MSDCPEFRKRHFRLTERDRVLISDVFAHRLMSSQHILDLAYFTSVSRCNRRLKLLCNAGLLCSCSPSRHSFDRHQVFRAAKAAKSLLADFDTITATVLHRLLSQGPSRTLAEHTLCIVDVRCSLVNSPNLTIARWLPEVYCLHEYATKIQGTWKRHVVRPDAYAEIVSNGRAQSFFIEVDLGTVSKAKILAKLRNYERYGDGVFQEVYGNREFTVIFVTDSMARLRWLRRTAAQIATTCVFSTFDSVANVLSAQFEKESAA